MKKQLVLAILLISLIISPLWANSELPKPISWLSDYAGLLDSREQNSLDTKLSQLEKGSSTQLFIVIVNEIPAEFTLETYSHQLASTWQIGSKKNNGVLLLVAIKESKVRIEVGYGLEGVLPDILASKIIRNEISPYFRQKAYYEGLSKASDAIILAVKGEYKGEKSSETNLSLFDILAVLFIIIIISIVGRGRGNRGRGIWIGHSGSSFSSFSSGGGSGSSFGGGGGGSFGGGGASGSW